MSKSQALHFIPSYRKIARARKHVASIESELRDAIEAAPARTVGMLPDGVTLRFNSPLSADQADDIATLVGDVLHNLRSALDIAAVEAVRLNDKSPKGVHFPFSNTEEELDDQIKRCNFQRAGVDCLKIVWDLRPYNGPNGNKQLRALHDLDIIDKHQTLMLLKQVVFIPTVFFRTPGGGRGVISQSQFSSPVGQEAVMDMALGTPESIRWDQDGCPPEFRIPMVELEFDSGHPFERRPAVPTLYELCDMVNEIINTFSALFRSKDD